MRPLSPKRHKRLFTRFGPLAGFAAKIEIAFAINLFGEHARNDLRAVKDIRDLFAQKLDGAEELTFDHPDIEIRCDNFNIVKKAVATKGMDR